MPAGGGGRGGREGRREGGKEGRGGRGGEEGGRGGEERREGREERKGGSEGREFMTCDLIGLHILKTAEPARTKESGKSLQTLTQWSVSVTCRPTCSSMCLSKYSAMYC